MQDFATRPPGDDGLLLPWHATGRLSPAQSRRLDAALQCDAALAGELAAIRQERAAVIVAHERLGAPSPRALLALFAAIDGGSAFGKISS